MTLTQTHTETFRGNASGVMAEVGIHLYRLLIDTGTTFTPALTALGAGGGGYGEKV